MDLITNEMYSKLPNLILGFHGCRKQTYEKVLYEHQHLKKSENEYDWLGNGIYFWENNYQRAKEWANNRYNDDGMVIGAVLDLGYCLNLTDYESTSILQMGYELLKSTCIEDELPKNLMGKSKTDLSLPMVEAFSTYKGCVFHFLSFMLLYVERPFYKSIFAKILNFENDGKDDDMDQQKIGRFIAEMRKKQGYTQKEIAEQLGISDKAVSKWETGRSMPDNSIMLPLCELLNINVNELLSGESLSVTEYSRKAEENMMNLMKDSDERKRHARRTRISMVIWVVTLMLLMMVMISNVETSELANLLYYIDVPGIIYVVSIVLISLACSGQINDFFRAFFYVVHGTEDEQKMEMSIKAVRFAERTFLVGGAFVTVFFAIYVLSHVDVIAKTNQVLCANLAVMLTTMVYGCLGALLLAPIRSRLEKMQIM